MAKNEMSEDVLTKLVEMDPDKEIQNQYTWDEDYQRLILGLLLTDRYFLVQSLNLVKPMYFVNEAHRLICRVLFNYFEKYKTLPSKTFLSQDIKDSLAGRDNAVILYYLGELSTVYEYYRDGIDSKEAFLDKIVTFAKCQSMQVAFYKSLDVIKKHPAEDATWAAVTEMLREAISIDKNFDPGLDYFQTFEDRYMRMKQEEETSERFTTGFDALDQGLVGGGLSKGEIGAWLGLPGVGKSLALVTAAVQNLMRGKKVLYISLEMDQDKIAQRFDAQLADCPIDRLYEMKDQVFSALGEHVRDFSDKRMLVVKQFPPGMCDVNMIRAYHSQMIMHGFKPELMIVDYVGEMKDTAGIPTWESRYRLLRDLRGFGVEQGHCTFTALQPNRDAVEAQQQGHIDESKLGDSFNQNRPLDALWTINQTMNEKTACIGRIYVAKHRNGKSRYAFKIKFDYQERRTLKMFQISDDLYKVLLNEVKSTNTNETQVDTLDVSKKPKKEAYKPGQNEV